MTKYNIGCIGVMLIVLLWAIVIIWSIVCIAIGTSITEAIS